MHEIVEKHTQIEYDHTAGGRGEGLIPRFVILGTFGFGCRSSSPLQPVVARTRGSARLGSYTYRLSSRCDASPLHRARRGGARARTTRRPPRRHASRRRQQACASPPSPPETHASKARPTSPKRSWELCPLPLSVTHLLSSSPRQALQAAARSSSGSSPRQWRPPFPTSARFWDAGVSCDKLARAMEGHSRDLLRGIGRGDAPPQEQRPGPERAQAGTEEVELNLGLSLGGRFGVDRKGEKLPRSSSVAAILTAALEVTAPPALGRTSSLPVQAEASEGGRTQGLDGWGSCHAVEPEARQRASLSPSSGSSDGEGLRLQDTLVRSTSLPAGIDATGTEEWRKRKAAQSLKRLELKRKRLERRNSHSLTCNSSKEAAGQILEEVKAHTDKLESCDGAAGRNNEYQSPMKGLPPKHHGTSTSHDNLSTVQRKSKPAAFKGTATSEEHSPSSAGSPGTMVASQPSSSSSLSGRAASLGCRGDQQSTSGKAAARARSMGDVERAMMREMPRVFTKGLPNGNRMEGFLYKYRKGEEVRIVCICHGSFHTPAGFVEHAGGGKVANPLRHIVVNPPENM